MAGVWRFSPCVVAVMLFIASNASAFNGRFGLWRAPTTTVSYTYVLPYIYYCVPTPTVIPVPDARPSYTVPPSSTGEPPLQKALRKGASDPRMPLIVTSHAISGNGIRGKSALPKDRCQVGFWNLSGRDVTLAIEGKSWTLLKDRAVTIDLDRQFSWQVDGRSQHVERVAEGSASHEVTIRD